MTLAPLISLFFTFWVYTNKQMFDNKIDTITSHNEIVLSHHLLSNINLSKLPTSSLALLMMVMFFILFWIGYYLFHKFNKKVYKAKFITIPSYFSVLSTA